MAGEADAFFTPICEVIRHETNPKPFVPFKEPQQVRACRKGRKKRTAKGVIISEGEYQEQKAKL